MEITKLQEEWREEVRAHYEQGMAEITAQFQTNPGSRKAIRNRTVLIDRIITHIRRKGEQALPKMPKMAILATGGYGRSEMFFHSDIDLMFLVEEGKEAQVTPLINLVLYLLWDLKLKIGHSVRSIPDAMVESLEDTTIRTNLLEARRITGSRTLAKQFFEVFNQKIVQGREREFIQDKLEERQERLEKHGDSRALLEPNIKNGKGGLRDLQTLMWLMRACYGVKTMGQIAALGKISQQELRDFRRARKFLHLVRLHLHDIAGRPEERLNFDAQRIIAERLGYRGREDSPNQMVERFMKRYFQVTRTVSQLTRTLCFLVEEEWGSSPRTGIRTLWKRGKLPDGLTISGNRLGFENLEVMKSQPQLMVEIFWYAHHVSIDIHPASWQMMTRNLKLIDREVRRNVAANEAFMQLLLDKKNPVLVLKKMNEAGVLGKFIPDFGRLAGQMQFDLYHTFTVDEHILTAIGYLHQMEQGELRETVPLAHEIWPRIQMRRVVYLALLCHDIAKGRGGSHHLKGVEIGLKLAKRFGFDHSEQQALGWLIEFHQHMSMIAFKRDLDDAKTIEHFSHQVQSLQWLKMLYVLTIADIHAVAPTIWNSWKAGLLETLYRRTERLLGGENQREQRKDVISHLQQALMKELPTENSEQIDAYLQGADRLSLRCYDAATHARIFPSWLVVQQGERFGIRFRSYPEQAITNVTIATRDRRGLFAQLAGVLALCGASIMDARIFTREDGVVVDRFAIQDEKGKAYDEERRQELIKSRLQQLLAGELDLADELSKVEKRYPAVHQPFVIPAKVFLDNEASSSHTLLEIQAVDRRGLLYQIAQLLTDMEITISTAHIATYGEKVVDSFYLKDAYGHKLHHWDKQRKLKECLMALLEED